MEEKAKGKAEGEGKEVKRYQKLKKKTKYVPYFVFFFSNQNK